MFDTLRCMYQISDSSNMSEGTETTAKVIARLQNDWRREVGAILIFGQLYFFHVKLESSREMRVAKDNLGKHAEKVRNMTEELDGAEAWQDELGKRLSRMEESYKPHLLVVYEKLEEEEGVDQKLLWNAFMSSEKDLLNMLSERVGRVRQMERPALMRLVDFLLRVRRLAYEEDKSEATSEVEALLRIVVREISRVDINWIGLSDWEELALKDLMGEVGEAVPGFLLRLVQQLLERVSKKEMSVQTE